GNGDAPFLIEVIDSGPIRVCAAGAGVGHVSLEQPCGAAIEFGFTLELEGQLAALLSQRAEMHHQVERFAEAEVVDIAARSLAGAVAVNGLLETLDKNRGDRAGLADSQSALGRYGVVVDPA